MEHLFTTPIKIVKLNHEEINPIIGKAQSLKFKNNFNENLPKEEADKIEKIFINEAELYLKELTDKQIDLKLKQSWTTATLKYQFQTPHEHSGNTVIGVYYVHTNEKSGDILLHDPRGANSFIPSFEDGLSGRSYHRITPKTGDLLLFPAYIVHSVEPNLSDETRISLAMNFEYKDFNQFR